MQDNITNETEIFVKMQDVFQEVFDNKDLKLNPDTSLDEIDGCDSITQVQITMEIEKSFQIELCHEEVIQVKNIADLVGLIKRHIV